MFPGFLCGSDHGSDEDRGPSESRVLDEHVGWIGIRRTIATTALLALPSVALPSVVLASVNDPCVRFVDVAEGDTILPDHEIAVRGFNGQFSLIDSMEIDIDGEIPEEFVGCEGPAHCTVRTMMAPGTRVLTVTAQVSSTGPDEGSWTISESITVEVAASSLQDDGGCRTGAGGVPGWMVLLLLVGAPLRRRGGPQRNEPTTAAV